jgi:3-oxoacyl-[acyl-carrier-protein] synthase III
MKTPIMRQLSDTMQRMSIPNREALHNPTPEYINSLMQRIGKSQVWVADRTGISRRRIQYMLVGSKVFAGETQEVTMTYPEQFILEALADAGEAFAKPK